MPDQLSLCVYSRNDGCHYRSTVGRPDRVVCCVDSVAVLLNIQNLKFDRDDLMLESVQIIQKWSRYVVHLLM